MPLHGSSSYRSPGGQSAGLAMIHAEAGLLHSACTANLFAAGPRAAAIAFVSSALAAGTNASRLPSDSSNTAPLLALLRSTSTTTANGKMPTSQGDESL